MSARKKTKLCWHCHGTISIEATHCAYCGEHCESHRSTTAPYFPPLADEEKSVEVTTSDRDEAASQKLFCRTWWGQFQELLKIRSKILLRFLRDEPSCSFLLLTWGIFFALLTICLSVFTAKDQLIIALSTRFWWIYGLIASTLIWIGLLLPKK